MKSGSLANYEVAKIVYSSLEQNKFYENTEGYVNVSFDEIYDITQINDFLDYVVEEFKDKNGLICIQNNSASKNVIETKVLVDYGFMKYDKAQYLSIFVYKINKKALNPSFVKE